MNHILTFFHILTKPRDNMNAHLTLQARLYDLEESEKKLEVQRPVDGNEEAGALNEHEASAEAEVEEVHVPIEDVKKQTADSDNGDVNEIVGRELRVLEENDKEEEEQESDGDGGHTPGEVWTESPHFLWGP
jgi:hypothetical protein